MEQHYDSLTQLFPNLDKSSYLSFQRVSGGILEVWSDISRMHFLTWDRDKLLGHRIPKVRSVHCLVCAIVRVHLQLVLETQHGQLITNVI